MINLPMYPVFICLDEANRLCEDCKALMREMLLAMQTEPFYKRYLPDM